MSSATPIYEVGAVVLGYVGHTASWRRYAPGKERIGIEGQMLCITQVASADEGVHEPAQSITITNRPALLALRSAIDEALAEHPAYSRKELEAERDELLTALGECRDAMPDTTANINEAIAFPTSVPAYVRESVSLLVAQRDELLRWLRWAAKLLPEDVHSSWQYEQARAAIAKAEGAA